MIFVLFSNRLFSGGERAEANGSSRQEKNRIISAGGVL